MSIQMHTISGFVGNDPETRTVTLANGDERNVTTMSVAVNDTRRKDAPPVWYRVTMWQGLGDTVARYVRKGDFVVVSADRLNVSTYINRAGEASATLELTARSVDFSGNRRRRDVQNQADSAPRDVQNTPDEEPIPF